jgi:hypothetical protein
MTLDELRDALEMAKLSAKSDPPEAVLRNLLDWCESVQQFLEVTHGPTGDAQDDAAPVDVPQFCPAIASALVASIKVGPCGLCNDHKMICSDPGDPETKVGQVWSACPKCNPK